MEQMEDNREEEAPSHINILPAEIVGQVLGELTVVDKLQCERVNRRWKAITRGLGWTEQKKLSYGIVFKGATESQVEKFNSVSLITLFRRTGANLIELDLESFSICILYSFKYRTAIFRRFDLLPRLSNLDIMGIKLNKVVEFLPYTLIELRSTGPFNKQNLEALSLKCPNLESIHFGNDDSPVKWSVSVVNAFLGRCQNLKTIHFVGEFIPRRPRVSLTSLGQLESLEELHLQGIAAFDDVVLMAVVTGCPRLKSLKLADIGVSECVIRKLDQHPNLIDFELMHHPELNGNIEKGINERWKIKKYNYLRSLSDDVSTLRKMLNEAASAVDLDSSESIDDLVERGYLPILVKGLSSTNIELQSEALELLDEVASGTDPQTSAVVEAGAVPEFLKLLGSESEKVREGSLWALTNIIDTSSVFRDQCIQLGIIETLLKVIEMEKSIDILRQIALIFKKICQWGNFPLPIDVVQAILSVLRSFVQNSDKRVLLHTVWALSSIAEEGNEQIQRIIDLGFLPHLISLIDHSEEVVRTATISVLSNIASGTDDQVQMVLDFGVLKMMPALFTYHNQSTMTEDIMRFFANIARNEKWVQLVLDTGLMPAIIQILVRTKHLRDEALTVISNIAKHGRSEHIHHLVDFGVIPPFCDLLDDDDSNDLCQDILDALNNILVKSGTRIEEISKKIVRYEGLEYIRDLREQESESIKKVAGEIIDKYFPQSEEQDQTLNNEEMEI